MKYTTAMKNVNRIKIVTPDWVYDSAKAKKKLDEERYHPKLLLMPSSPERVLSVDPLSTLSSSDGSPFSEDVAEQLNALVNYESDEVDGRELEPSLTLTPPALLRLSVAEPKVPLLVQTADSTAVTARPELLSKPLLSPHRSSNPLPDVTPPLQMKSSLWMTQQVQGAFGQPQLAPPPSPVNPSRESVTWGMPGDRQNRDSAPSTQQMTQQQHSLVWQQHLPQSNVQQPTLSPTQQPQLQASQGQQHVQQQQTQLQQSPQHIPQQHQQLQQHMQQQQLTQVSHIQQQQLMQQQQPGLQQPRPQVLKLMYYSCTLLILLHNYSLWDI